MASALSHSSIWVDQVLTKSDHLIIEPMGTKVVAIDGMTK